MSPAGLGPAVLQQSIGMPPFQTSARLQRLQAQPCGVNVAVAVAPKAATAMKEGSTDSQSPRAFEPSSVRNVERGFRAVLVVDIVESVRLIEADEEGVIARWLSLSDFIETSVLRNFAGRLVKSLGDGLLLEFGDVRSSALAAFAIQRESAQRNSAYRPEQQILLRMGIEVSDIIVGQNDIYGHGVNVAARLTTLAGPAEIIVSARAREHLTPVLDADVEDLGECFLKHIDAPVRAYRITPPGPHPTIKLAPRRVLLAPSIAVVPLAARMTEPEHEILGEVFADEIIDVLSRSRTIDVISRLSTTVFRGRKMSLTEIGGYLSVNYVLSGYYRTGGGKITLSLELAETHSDRIIWGERFRQDIDGILSGEQGFFDVLVARVSNAILNEELCRARSHPLPTLQTYTLLMGAIALMHRNSLPDFREAYRMLQAVIDRASREAVPNAWLANWHVLRVQQGWSDDVGRDAKVALDYSRRSIAADPQCSLALVVDGFVHTNLLKRLDIAQERYQGALEANPNNPFAWLLKGTMHAFMGDGDLAVSHTERALRLTPLDPHKYYYDCLSATACLAAHQYERALELAESSLRVNRNKTSTLRAKVVAEFQLGRCDAARATTQELLEREPNFTVGGWLSRSPSADYPIGKVWAGIFRELGVPE